MGPGRGADHCRRPGGQRTGDRSRGPAAARAGLGVPGCGPCGHRRTGGLPGRTGLVVPPRAPMELAAALRSLLDDPARCRALGRAGRAWVTERFSWAGVAAQTERSYRAVLGARVTPG